MNEDNTNILIQRKKYGEFDPAIEWKTIYGNKTGIERSVEDVLNSWNLPELPEPPKIVWEQAPEDEEKIIIQMPGAPMIVKQEHLKVEKKKKGKKKKGRKKKKGKKGKKKKKKGKGDGGGTEIER